MKAYLQFFLRTFLFLGLLSFTPSSLAQMADLPDIDKDRWKIGGFESKQEVETAIARIREAAQKEDVYLIKNMFVDFPIPVNCYDEKGFFKFPYVFIRTNEELVALWNILLKQERFSSLKSLKYEDLFINYNGATPTQTHSLWISKTFKNGVFMEPQIYAINSDLPCDMLVQSTTAHLQHIYYDDPWKVSGFSSKNTIIDVINRVKIAAEEHNIHIIKDLLKEFPITITCNEQPKLSAITIIDIDSIEKLQILWKVFLIRKEFIPLKTLSYDKLFIHNRGITSIEYPNLWITEFHDVRSSWNPKIYTINSPLSCDETISLLHQ